jgi:hypothetical protein
MVKPSKNEKSALLECCFETIECVVGGIIAGLGHQPIDGGCRHGPSEKK